VVSNWLAELDGRRVTVEVPASSANLGAGYDCLGLALDLVNRIDLEVHGWSRGAIELEIEGEGANELADDRRNRFVQGLEAALVAVRGDLPDKVGWRVKMRNRIPISRGLGSSAAATVGGLLAGNSLLGGPLSPADLVKLATDIEGHADNAAAALLGGFVVVDCSASPPTAIRFNVPRDLKVVLFIPELRLSTAKMRDVLPKKVPLEDAIANLGRVAIGVAGIASGTYEHLGALTQDRLHEQYRATVYPQFPALVQAARDAGAVGACLSGAGSSVIAFSDGLATLSRIEGAFSAVAADLDVPGRVAIAAPRNAGARVVANA
jgi:homoserine kinase